VLPSVLGAVNAAPTVFKLSSPFPPEYVFPFRVSRKFFFPNPAFSRGSERLCRIPPFPPFPLQQHSPSIKNPLEDHVASRRCHTLTDGSGYGPAGDFFPSSPSEGSRSPGYGFLISAKRKCLPLVVLSSPPFDCKKGRSVSPSRRDLAPLAPPAPTGPVLFLFPG